MPVITLEAASLNKEQKKQLVKEFTESAARIMNMPKDSFYVFLKENALDNVGVGGILLSGKKHSCSVPEQNNIFFLRDTLQHES